MERHRGVGRLLALACVWIFAGSAWGQNLVQDGSFESGALAPSWLKLARSGHGAWGVASGSPPATDGSRYAEVQFDFVDGTILYQDITLPEDGNYTVQLAAGCTLEGAKTPGDFCRVDVTDTSAETIMAPMPRTDTLASTAQGLIKPVFAADGGRGTVALKDTSPVRLEGKAGQVVRIRAMALASSRAIAMTLDNVRLQREAK